MSRRRVTAVTVPALCVALIVSGCSTSDPAAAPTAGTSGGSSTASSSTASSSTAASSTVASTSPSASPSAQAASTSSHGPSTGPSRSAGTSSRPTPSIRPAHVSTRSAKRLPVDEPTHGAKQVITVLAASKHSTTAVVQRWTRTSGGWQRVGPSATGNLGTDGLSRHASESRSATPIGSFTLTRAFGHDSDPGTRLPYVHTTPNDWWISQSGPLYNTRQRCDSHCGFTRGSPNEHLYYETPAYDYAVVIDYNTRNAPGGVRQGRGSAFFLHVSEGVPTAGCVSIPVNRLLSVLSWLKPADHPRIVIGTE